MSTNKKLKKIKKEESKYYKFGELGRGRLTSENCVLHYVVLDKKIIYFDFYN